MKNPNPFGNLLQLIPAPVRSLIGTACICAFALFLLGGPLSPRAAAFDDTINNHYAGDPAVQALVSGESAYRSIVIAENGELIVDGTHTHIWPATGTTKQWLAGLTIGNDTFVAQEGQFRLYRNRKLVDYTECALEYRWYSSYDRTITAGDDTVYLYDYRSVQTWDRATGTFKTLIDKTAYCTDFFEDTGWAFVYEEENATGTAYDNVVHVLNSKKGIDRVLAEHAIDLGGFNGFIEVRFFVNADADHPAKEKNVIGWAFDHYTALHKFASTGETDWWDEYGDHDVQRRLDEGTWYDPIPHRRWGSTGSGLFPSAYED